MLLINSKELKRWNGSLEHPKQLFNLKKYLKMFTGLCLIDFYLAFNYNCVCVLSRYDIRSYLLLNPFKPIEFIILILIEHYVGNSNFPDKMLHSEAYNLSLHF